MTRRVLKTSLCKMLGIESPILLAVAGCIGESGLTTEAVRSVMRKLRTLTDKPFGVDLLAWAVNSGEKQ